MLRARLCISPNEPPMNAPMTPNLWTNYQLANRDICNYFQQLHIGAAGPGVSRKLNKLNAIICIILKAPHGVSIKQIRCPHWGIIYISIKSPFWGIDQKSMDKLYQIDQTN